MKSKLLLLDANVVIELMRLGIWDVLLRRCDVSLAETVAAEVHTTPVEHGIGHAIDLNEFAKEGLLTIIAMPVSSTNAFLDQFGSEYADRLDPGELESLAILQIPANADAHICSADAIVYRTLGLLDRREQAVSLEAILKSIGLARPLDRQYGDKFMNELLDRGFRDRIEGSGFNRKKK